MTDNEIIKALECCGVDTSCEGCPYHDVSLCQDNLCKDALSLINRQKAEIERLQGLLVEWKKAGYKYADSIENIKAEAIKEFAERLKREAVTHKNFGELVYVEDIDNLVKEMVGERE